MTNAKITKRALVSSVLALFLCFAMLIGTTFAWFTDSASSGSNVIQAGNLDIEVEYTLDGENWNALDGATDLFQKGLWEPGHTEVVALKIENKGSLALKYSVNMNIFNEVVGKNKDGEDIVLSDILTVSTLTQQANDAMGVGDIVLMLAYLGEDKIAYQTTTSFKDANILGENQSLLAGDAYYLFIKVDMDENVGNEANHDGENVPSIEFGLNVLATQYTYENDSFGNQYDKEAEYDESWNTLADTSWHNAEATEFTLTNAYQLAGLAKLVNTGADNFAGKTVKLANNVDLENKAWRTIGTSSATAFAGTFDGNGKTVSNLLVETENGFGGLFGYVLGSATISNIELNNVTINGTGSNANRVGAAVGYSNGAATISNVNVTGLIQISADGLYVGGVVGQTTSGKITNCSVVGEDGSYIKSGRWVGGISGYDNGAYKMSNCHVENIDCMSTVYVGGLAGLGGVGYNKTESPEVYNNSVKDVTLVVTSEAEADKLGYGALVGGVNLYSYSKKPIIIYNNTYENVVCTVSAVAADVQEMGSKYPDGTDKGLIIVPSLKVGNGYYSFVKPAFVDAPKDGTEYVIELVGDSMFTSNVKPAVASGQNIVIKTNGYQLLFVESDANGALYNEDGTLKATVITNENMSSYITIKNGGTLVIE